MPVKKTGKKTGKKTEKKTSVSAEERKIKEHFQVAEIARRRRRRDLLGSLLVGSDTASLVLAHLPIRDLLRCSMTCRALLKMVDESKNSAFNKNLRWWGNFHEPWHKPPAVITAPAKGFGYKNTYRLENDPTVQYLWLLNVVPVKGARVHLRMHLNLALDSVNLIGDVGDVARVREKGHVSMDVLEWEILSVKRDETPPSPLAPRFRYVRSGVVGELRMRAITYLHHVRSVELVMNAPVIITFQNIPIMDTPLSFRELFVLKCVYHCMHCHQRLRRWLSVDASHPEHRALCSVCLEHLYVEEKFLETKFKCLMMSATGRMNLFRDRGPVIQGKKPSLDRPTFPTLQNMRTHFVMIDFGAATRTSLATPKVAMLKSDVAGFLGHSSWTQLLACNYKNGKVSWKHNRSPNLFFPSESW